MPWAIVAVILLGLLILILSLCLIGVLAYALKDRIQSLVNRWSILREGQFVDSRHFEQAIQRRLLQNGDRKEHLYEQMLKEYKSQLTTERHERLMAEHRAIEMQLNLEKIEVQSIEISKGFLDVARMQANRLDPIGRAIKDLLEERKESRETIAHLSARVEALGFVIAQFAFPGQRKSFDDLVQEIRRQAEEEVQ